MPDIRKWLRTTTTCPVFIVIPLGHFPIVPVRWDQITDRACIEEALAAATALEPAAAVTSPGRSEYDLQRELLLSRSSRTNET
jgi:hypothetical protein